MRTKTLLAACAALALGLATSQAQPVYSANVVGYVNVTVAGSGNYTLLSNPLDFDGTGIHDTVVNVLGAQLPVGSSIETWTPTGGFGTANSYAAGKSGNAWTSPSQTLPPGEGFFVINPGSAVTLTFVGQVMQGGVTNQFLNQPGYSLIGGVVPIVGGLTSIQGYNPSVGDSVLTWTPVTGYAAANSYAALKSGNAWTAGQPSIGLGQGFFLITTNVNPVMGTNFMVQ